MDPISLLLGGTALVGSFLSGSGSIINSNAQAAGGMYSAQAKSAGDLYGAEAGAASFCSWPRPIDGDRAVIAKRTTMSERTFIKPPGW